MKYNRQLKELYNRRDTIDPISLKDIDDSNEWLVGRMDGNFDDEEELVFGEEDDLTWNVVAEAVGAYEPVYHTKNSEKGSSSSSMVASGSKGKDSSKTRSSIVQLLDENNSDEEQDISNEFSDENEADDIISLDDDDLEDNI